MSTSHDQMADHPEAVATQQELDKAWADLKANGIDAPLFVKLLAISDRNSAEAVVLWDLLQFASITQKSYLAWRRRSGEDLVADYSDQLGHKRRFNEAVLSLELNELIEIQPAVRNTARLMRVNWPVLHRALTKVSDKLPGLKGQVLP